MGVAQVKNSSKDGMKKMPMSKNQHMNNKSKLKKDFDKHKKNDQSDIKALNNLSVAKRNSEGENPNSPDKKMENDEKLLAEINSNQNQAITYVNKAFVLKGLNQYDGALDFFQKAINIDPKNSKIYFCKGNLYYDMNLYKEAIQLYDLTLNLDSKNLFAYYKKAECYKQLKNFKESIKCYEVAGIINPWDFYTFYNKGNLHYDLKEFKLALECYNKAIKINPDNQYVYYNKANTLRQLKLYEESISAYNKSISLEPNNSSFYNNKGIALKKIKHYNEAIECFYKAKELNPEDTSIYNNLGNTYCEMNNYEEALEYYDISIRMNYHDPLTYNNKAFVLFKLKRPAEALECYDQAISMNPNDVVYMNNKMNILDEVENLANDTSNKKKMIKSTSKSIINAEHLSVIRKLNQGNLGRLLLGEFKAKKVLIKKFIINDHQKDELYNIFVKEATSIVSLVHPNIVTYIGCCKDKEDDLCLISNYCSEGNLHSMLHDRSIEISMETKIKILIDVAKGINFLHTQKKPIIYKDLKSCNILLDKQNDDIIAKLTDFDLTGFVNLDISNKLDPIYWSPIEVLNQDSISLEVDTYSFAILMWEVFSREVPYREFSEQYQIINHIKKGGRPNLNDIDKNTPIEVIELIKRCWQTKKEDRPNFNEIINNLVPIFKNICLD